MKKAYLLALLVYLLPQALTAQTLLSADGPGNTYELINSVLAPNYNVVEVPDCKHTSFGRHIEEVFDADLNKYVFKFHIHTSLDDDRCINFDRQRNEIKTYDKSPANLKATFQEKVEYKWKFKLDSAFQPSSSFTHLHQIKAVGGSESSMPSITLTARKSSPDRLELRYAETTSQTTLAQTDLAPLKGIWLEATETIFFDEIGLGEYKVIIQNVATGDTLFDYENNAIRMWKTDADFLRPKWGIYRSLNDSTSLRDEEILFADFSVDEIIASSTNSVLEQQENLIYPNPANDQIQLSESVLGKYNRINIYNTSGQLVLNQTIQSNYVSIIHLEAGIYFVELKGEEAVAKKVKILVR